MKVAVALLLFVAALLPGKAAERVLLYAMLVENTTVDLTDGSKWLMDKGDCFPVVAYTQGHTMVILQLASTSFLVPEKKTRIVPEKDLPAAIANYRGNVNTYINGYTAKWRAAAEAASSAAAGAEDASEGRKPE